MEDRSVKNNIDAQNKINDIRLSLFSKTKLYAQLFDWQTENGYVILKNVA